MPYQKLIDAIVEVRTTLQLLKGSVDKAVILAHHAELDGEGRFFSDMANSIRYQKEALDDLITDLKTKNVI